MAFPKVKLVESGSWSARLRMRGALGRSTAERGEGWCSELLNVLSHDRSSQLEGYWEAASSLLLQLIAGFSFASSFFPVLSFVLGLGEDCCFKAESHDPARRHHITERQKSTSPRSHLHRPESKCELSASHSCVFCLV